MVTLPLLANIPKCVLRPALVVFIQNHQLRVIEHVNFLELAGGAIVTRHHVNRQVDQIHNFTVALSNSSGLDHDEIKPQRLEKLNRVVEYFTGGKVLPPCCHGAHVDAVRAQTVHTNPITEQSAAGATPGGINRQNCDSHIRKRPQKAVQQLINHAAFAGTAGPGDSDHG